MHSNVVLVVLFRNQIDNWLKIYDGITKLTVKPLKTIIAMDRPSNDDFDVVSNTDSDIDVIRIHFDKDTSTLKNWNGVDDPFLAGFVRNKAIEYASIQYVEMEGIIFIDGDCIPQSNLIASHSNVLHINQPIITVGRRREKEFGWRDRREVESSLLHYGLFKDGGFLVQSVELLKQSLVLWSCNVGINKLALQRIKMFNAKYYNRSEIFDSDFDGAWGGEDGFLGVVAWLSKTMITTITPIDSGVMHISHPRPSDKYTIQHKKLFDDKISDIKKRMQLNPLTIEFFR